MKKPTLTDKIAIFLTVALIIGAIISLNIRHYKLTKKAKYTVGVTMGMRYGGQSARYVKYYFKLDGKIIEGDCSMYKSVNIDSGKYIVAYYEKNPNLNLLIIDCPLPDSFRVGMKLDTILIGINIPYL